MKYTAKMNRHERRIAQQEKMESNLKGSGLYIFENNTDGDLKLPKPTATGIRVVGPRKRFEGDSYFMQLVGPPMNLLRLVEVVQPKQTTAEIAEQIQKETTMAGEKLILDQPDTITTRGKIEHVVDDTVPKQPLNDSTNQTSSDVLLNEQPLAGLEIIKGS